MPVVATKPNRGRPLILQLTDRVYDIRKPDRIGFFCGWAKTHGRIAIVKFRGKRPVMLAERHIGIVGREFMPASISKSPTSAVEVGREVEQNRNGDNKNSKRQAREQARRMRRMASLAVSNAHLKPLADKYGLSVEDYLDAIL